MELTTLGRRISFSLMCWALLAFAGSSPAFGAKVSYVFNARLLGGQYFFENQESELSGNASVLMAPAVQLSEKWTLIPSVNASWRGTKNVQDLVGGGTLFQQTQDHSGNVKAVFKPNEAWQFKGGGGYRIQLLKETKDETWGKGLFDFEKPGLNVETERFFSKDTSLRAGYDFYWIDFRNYVSLESTQRDLGRENAGSKTLNTKNYSPYLAFRSIFSYFGQKAFYDLSYFHTLRDFTQQKVVLATGELSPDFRRDQSMIAAASVSLPYVFSENFKVIHDLRLTANGLVSNQNNYDAGKTRFNDNYYAYKEFSVSSSKSFLVGPRPWIFSAGFTYARRNYDSRPTQNDAGDYGSEKIHQNDYYANFSATYPVNKNFKVQALGSLGWSRSNMKYERTYRYNYETFTYLLGVVYDY